ncbi:MAG: nucleotidyltransferase family protein [candidate division NC10 bacterium]|nr:nucleotidyltransferase family protein [candidate division NC10 bacterium]
MVADRVPDRIVESLITAVPDDPDSFKRLCAAVTDWNALFECGDRQGVAGVLYCQLVESDCSLPQAVRRYVDRELVVRRLWNSHLNAALDEALYALDAAGVRTVALKGPVLGERLYSDPAVRLSTDLDLLVVPSDLDRAAAALESIGYRAEKGQMTRSFRQYHQHIHFHRPHSPMIELHFRAYAGLGVVVPGDEFVSRACLYRTTRGPVAWVLSPEDELLYLSVHVASHCFGCLLWLYDLKLLLRSCPDLDWSVVAGRARSLGVVAPLSLTFEMLRRRLGVAVPERDDLAPSRGIRSRVAASLLRATATRPVSPIGATLARLAFMAALCGRPAPAARFLQYQLVRIAKRRAQRYFPSLVPEEWSV